ncbi:hypothetical protein LR48_Vigan10g034900 [Vigna angularis]|uniref:DNA methyltransferase 1-associated 1 domain-containing protein n=1 Tax=Phaseolus angularis TaxID=3914 RepID=A0A0L9VHT7_PHAAN|nr:hypothetical protein LR48_Vigan10g034900 [Vigna angularis]
MVSADVVSATSFTPLSFFARETESQGLSSPPSTAVVVFIISSTITPLHCRPPYLLHPRLHLRQIVLVEAKRIAESRIPPKVAEESHLAASNAGAEATERAVPGETVSPSNVQLPSMVVPPTLSDNASTLASLRMLRVYLRTYALEQMVQAANSSAGLRTIKRVEQTLQDLGVNLKPRVPTKAVCAEHLELRKEILTWLNLQKQVQYKEAEGSSFRDGSYGETPGTPKVRNLAFSFLFSPLLLSLYIPFCFPNHVEGIPVTTSPGCTNACNYTDFI